MDASTVTGLAGAPQAGVGERMDGWRTMPLGRLAQLSPSIALALARGDQLVPYIANCKATFSDPNVSTIYGVTMEGVNNGPPIVQATVIDHIDYQIDQQNAFAGQTLKSLADFFFGMQSGIMVNMDVFGAPAYSPLPFFTPIRSAVGFLRRAWPMGWFLRYNNGIKMDFNASIPLPSLPVNVAVSFCMWTPADARYVRLSDRDALAQLRDCGVTVPGC
jgi:hypothetical protein